MGTGAPIFGRPSLVASAAFTTEPCAPVSMMNGNGPFPLMHTLAIAATWDSRVLTVTGMLVPPPGSRRAPVQPCPAGGSANRAIPIILVRPGLLAGEPPAGDVVA